MGFQQKFIFLQQTALKKTAATIRVRPTPLKAEFSVRSGSLESRIRKRLRKTFSRKCRPLKIIAEIRVERKARHGVTHWIPSLDGSTVIFRNAVTYLVDSLIIGMIYFPKAGRANDHLIEFQLIEIVFYQLIEIVVIT